MKVQILHLSESSCRGGSGLYHFLLWASLQATNNICTKYLPSLITCSGYEIFSQTIILFEHGVDLHWCLQHGGGAANYTCDRWANEVGGWLLWLWFSLKQHLCISSCCCGSCYSSMSCLTWMYPTKRLKTCDADSVVHSQESHGQHHVWGEEELLKWRFSWFPGAQLRSLPRRSFVYKTLVFVVAIRLIYLMFQVIASNISSAQFTYLTLPCQGGGGV